MPTPRQRAQPRPGQQPYRPWGAAEALLYSRAPELLLDGPAGTGKSRAALEKLHILASKYAGCRLLLVRKTRASLTQTAMVTFERHVLPAGSAVYFHGGDQEYRYPNGSVIVVGGMDKPIKVMSAEYDAAYVNEATELLEGDWESITTRLRNGVLPFQQIFGDVNPGAPTHWLNQRANRGTVQRLLSRHEDNPVLWDRRRGAWTPAGVAYIARLDALTGVRKARLRYGKWVAADGQIYSDWDAARHLVAAADLAARGVVPLPAGAGPDTPPSAYIPAGWARYRVIDFGFVHPFVCQWWAEDGDGRLYRYRELYGTGRLVEDWATAIGLAEIAPSALAPLRAEWRATEPGAPTDARFLAWVRSARPRALESIVATLADHDAEDRATLARHGIPTLPAPKEVSPGIQAVAARWRPAGDGRPRLYLLRDALVRRDPTLAETRRPCCTEEEIDGYVWETRGAGLTGQEAPHKEDDHGCDAMRYLVLYRDGGFGTVTYGPDPWAAPAPSLLPAGLARRAPVPGC